MIIFVGSWNLFYIFLNEFKLIGFKIVFVLYKFRDKVFFLVVFCDIFVIQLFEGFIFGGFLYKKMRVLVGNFEKNFFVGVVLWVWFKFL